MFSALTISSEVVAFLSGVFSCIGFAAVSLVIAYIHTEKKKAREALVEEIAGKVLDDGDNHNKRQHPKPEK